MSRAIILVLSLAALLAAARVDSATLGAVRTLKSCNRACGSTIFERCSDLDLTDRVQRRLAVRRLLRCQREVLRTCDEEHPKKFRRCMRPIVKHCDGLDGKALLPCWQKVLRQCRHRGADAVCPTTTTLPDAPTTTSTTTTLQPQATTTTTTAAPTPTTTSTTSFSTTTTTVRPPPDISQYIGTYRFAGSLVSDGCNLEGAPEALDVTVNVERYRASWLQGTVEASNAADWGLRPNYFATLYGSPDWPFWYLDAGYGPAGRPHDEGWSMQVNGVPWNRNGRYGPAVVPGAVELKVYDDAGTALSCSSRWEGLWGRPHPGLPVGE